VAKGRKLYFGLKDLQKVFGELLRIRWQYSLKGKGKCIYIALIFVVHARCSGMDHTVLPAITPMPAFTS